MTDDAYDRLEAQGEARELNGEPEPWDDEYWDGVLYDAVLPPERTEDDRWSRLETQHSTRA